MSDKVREILKELRHRLEVLYGSRLVQLVLYGSQARGDDEAGSDIDVLVVLKGPVSPCEEINRVSELKAKLCLDYEEVISCIFMDEEFFTNRQGPLLRNIRREGIPV
ncbi:MAG: nucleotidyltransferase domain-containing protein [Phycisphaerae bacterium]